mgnify:FL=1|tara:strand:- start:15 stop:269 length:255 start_codon:yes stop_codon:yes gene_type:complete
MIKYIATIKEWRDRLNGNTYFSAQIDDIEKESKHYIEFQYGYGSQAEYTCKEYLGLKGFNSDLPIKFITIPNCKQREVKRWGQE